jgi:tRNA dimethylallyltransferase
VIQDIYDRNKLPIVVGGSHLYVDALIKNYDLDTSIGRDERFNELSTEVLQEKLTVYDKTLVQKVGNNRKRLVRALQNFTDGNTMHNIKAKIYEPLYIVCTKTRVQLYQDINERVDQMIANG